MAVLAGSTCSAIPFNQGPSPFEYGLARNLPNVRFWNPEQEIGFYLVRFLPNVRWGGGFYLRETHMLALSCQTFNEEGTQLGAVPDLGLEAFVFDFVGAVCGGGCQFVAALVFGVASVALYPVEAH